MSTWTRQVTLGALIAGGLALSVYGADSSAVVPISPGIGTKAEPLPYGHKDFVPTPERPVGWRGDGSGQYPGAKPVTEWSETKNIIWKTPMPSWTHSTPVPVGNKVFTCAENTVLICCDAATGKILWSQNHDDLGSSETLKDAGNMRVSCPTPICDGKGVYARFGNGVNVAYDLDGKRQWLFVPENNKHNSSVSDASPALCGNRLVICIGSELIGLDTATGKEVWKYNTGQGDPGSHSPVIGRLGSTSLVIPQGGCALALDGKPVTPDMGIYACNTSPMFFDGVVYSVGEKRGGKGWNAAATLEVTASGITSKQLWKNRQGYGMGRQPDGPLGNVQERFFASPVVYEGLLVTQNQGGMLYAFNPATGEVVKKFSLALPAPPKGQPKIPSQGGWGYMSPAVAGGYLFISREFGPVVVLQGKELKEVARNYLDQSANGKRTMNGTCLAFQGNRIYQRTPKALYCIGEKP